MRFVFKDKKSQFGDREWFVRTVIVAGLKVDPAQIFCLQWNAAVGGYDLTLNSQQQYDQIQATFEEKVQSGASLPEESEDCDCSRLQPIRRGQVSGGVPQEQCANYTAAFGGLTHMQAVRMPQSEDLLKTHP